MANANNNFTKFVKKNSSFLDLYGDLRIVSSGLNVSLPLSPSSKLLLSLSLSLSLQKTDDIT
jgi:hypothetical protein